MAKRKPSKRQFEVSATTGISISTDVLMYGTRLYQDVYATTKDKVNNGKSPQDVHGEVLAEYGSRTAKRIEELKRMLEYHFNLILQRAMDDALAGKPQDFKSLV